MGHKRLYLKEDTYRQRKCHTGASYVLRERYRAVRHAAALSRILVEVTYMFWKAGRVCEKGLHTQGDLRCSGEQ